MFNVIPDAKGDVGILNAVITSGLDGRTPNQTAPSPPPGPLALLSLRSACENSEKPRPLPTCPLLLTPPWALSRPPSTSTQSGYLELRHLRPGLGSAQGGWIASSGGAAASPVHLEGCTVMGRTYSPPRADGLWGRRVQGTQKPLEGFCLQVPASQPEHSPPSRAGPGFLALLLRCLLGVTLLSA